ncbi:MAG: ATP-binding protein [Nitrospirae bacterium]|nr:ATP-binding protein [Nitrospirota bacterium]
MVNRIGIGKRIASRLNMPQLAAFISIVLILSIVTVVWTKDRTVKKIHAEAADRLNTYNGYLHDKVNNYAIFPQLLAERSHIVGFLKHPGEQIERNEYLSRWNKFIRASVTYIIDKKGIAIASSNYKDATSFVGNDYTFREYFQQAIKGIPHEDIAIGTVSKKLGYYRSYPVRDGGEIIGVVVIKYDVNIFIPKTTGKDEIFLIDDDDGVIFHTGDARYLYHTMHKLPEDTRQKINNDNSYAGEPLPPLPIIKESERNGIKFVTLRHFNNPKQPRKTYTGTEYIMLGTQDNTTVWNVHLLAGLSGVGSEVRKNLAYVWLSMFVFYLIAVFMNYRDKSITALQKSYRELSEEKAKSDKHLEEQEVLNAVLRGSLSSEPLEAHLKRNLDIILEHLSQVKGCISLYDETLKVLQIAVHRGFNKELLELCSIVPDGHCMCGLAASTKEVVFSLACKDERHTVTYDGMAEHGHFCVPIISSDHQIDRILGVINIWLDADYGRNVEAGKVKNEQDEVFIKNIAGIIAGVILRKQELQLIEQSRTESLTTLAAGIAHEINNPLSFIKASVGSIKRNLSKIETSMGILLYAPELLSEEQIELLRQDNTLGNTLSAITTMNTKIESSNKGVDRIMEVVNGLRTFSRLNKMDVEDVDLNKCIDEALSVCLNENNKVEIVKKYGELPLYHCESRAMNQCFYHIIQNAFQAVAAAKTDTGTIRIATSHEGERINIRIDDNGIGMSEDAVRRAFVPFFTTKEVGSGKGLGLSMVDGIIKRHGGTVKIGSVEGKGTSIIISLPFIQNDLNIF